MGTRTPARRLLARRCARARPAGRAALRLRLRLDLGLRLRRCGRLGPGLGIRLRLGLGLGLRLGLRCGRVWQMARCGRLEEKPVRAPGKGV